MVNGITELKAKYDGNTKEEATNSPGDRKGCLGESSSEM